MEKTNSVKTNITKKEHLQAIEHFDYCKACHSKLNFYHQVDYINHLVFETCQCTNCGENADKKTYVLN